MNSAAFIVTLISTIAAFLVICTNVFLVFENRRRKKELILFYFRFHVDIVFGATYFFYSFFILGFSAFGTLFFIENEYLFYLGLPFSNASAGRTLLVLLIVVDRILASYFPISYHLHRPRIPTILILILPIFFMVLEDFVIIFVCGGSSHSVLDTCVAFPCTLNQCAYSWWTSYKSVVFPVIIGLSVVLCMRLLVFSKQLKNSRISMKANRLALLDAFIVFFFDFLPAFCANQFPDAPFIAYTVSKKSGSYDYDLKNVGPLTAMLKQVGRAIESFIVIEILLRPSGEATKSPAMIMVS